MRLRVYGWQGVRKDVPGWHHTSREIVAAPSKVAAARAAGVRHPRYLFNLSETGNQDEIFTAMSAPGVIFYRGADAHGPWARGAD